jgi:hypothetical protein
MAALFNGDATIVLVYRGLDFQQLRRRSVGVRMVYLVRFPLSQLRVVTE